MKVEYLETFLVCTIVVIQLIVFFRMLAQISLLGKIVPPVEFLKVSKIRVPVADLEKLTPAEILDNMERYKAPPGEYEYHAVDPGNDITLELMPDGSLQAAEEAKEDIQAAHISQLEEITVIESERWDNKILNRILFSANNYLIRNRGAASDFNLIKDIAERNINAVEESISTSVAIPLYLGLMGTMIGVVIGLFNIPDLSVVLGSNAKDTALNQGISLLIGGVKIAMIASFVGLLLTIIISGGVFKASRSLLEERKNELYTFIQIELLPIINQGLASTLGSLQRNLLKFNSEFSVNLRGLSGIFDENRKTIASQKELLDAISKTKIAEVTSYNIQVLAQLNTSMRQFERFNYTLSHVDIFADNAMQLVSRTNDLLARTDDFKTIAADIKVKLDQSRQLMEFLTASFKELDIHREYTNKAVEQNNGLTQKVAADVGHTMSQAFKDLEEHILNSSEAVKRFTIDEMELLKNALSEGKAKFADLEYLGKLSTDLDQFKNSTASQGERIKQQLEDLNKNIMALNISGKSASRIAGVPPVQDDITSSKLEEMNKNIEASVNLLKEIQKNNVFYGLKTFFYWLFRRR